LPRPINPFLGLEAAYALLPGALALALLGGIESIAIGKTIAARTGESIVANQEFFAQGLKNFLTSFFQCIPGSGSFTRSILDYEAGAETRFAAVMNAIFVGVIVLTLGRFATFIPLAALAAVLFVVAFGLIDWRYPLRVWRADRSDAVVFLVTALSTIFLPLEYAIFLGIFLNIAFYLRSSARLHIAEMIPTPAGSFVERPIFDEAGNRQVVFVQLEGELFFAVADDLHERLASLRRSDVRVVILRLKRTHSIDASVLYVLERFVRDMHAANKHVLLCGIRDEVRHALVGYGLIRLIGRDNVFQAGGGVFTSAKRALSRARQLLDRPFDEPSHPALDDALNYEI
jgi:sulfate permease, SulP family